MKNIAGRIAPVLLGFGLWTTGNVLLAPTAVRGDELTGIFQVCAAKWKREYVQGFCNMQSFAHCGLEPSNLYVIKNRECKASFSFGKCKDVVPSFNVAEDHYQATCSLTAGGVCTIDHVKNVISWQLIDSTTTTGTTCTGTPQDEKDDDTSLPEYCSAC